MHLHHIQVQMRQADPVNSASVNGLKNITVHLDGSYIMVIMEMIMKPHWKLYNGHYKNDYKTPMKVI